MFYICVWSCVVVSGLIVCFLGVCEFVVLFDCVCDFACLVFGVSWFAVDWCFEMCLECLVAMDLDFGVLGLGDFRVLL